MPGPQLGAIVRPAFWRTSTVDGVVHVTAEALAGTSAHNAAANTPPAINRFILSLPSAGPDAAAFAADELERTVLLIRRGWLRRIVPRHRGRSHQALRRAPAPRWSASR